MDLAAIHDLFGKPPSSECIERWLDSLSSADVAPAKPVVKSYPDAAYHAHHALGLDMVYGPSPAGSISTEKKWQLERIDLYNPLTAPTPAPTPSTSGSSIGSSRRRPAVQYHPLALPLVVQLPATPADPVSDPQSSTETPSRSTTSRPAQPRSFSINARTTGRDFVRALGEPGRKGGGTGWVGPWLEWPDLRISRVRSRPSTSAGPGEGSEENAGRAEVERSDGSGEASKSPPDKEECRMGLMVELRDSGLANVSEQDMKQGLGGLWDRAAGWEWGCIKIFEVGSTI